MESPGLEGSILFVVMSDSYIIFARKYRPLNFDEVLGQEVNCQILKKSLDLGKLPQAWLFAGPSGVGKTTCARILARALSCSQNDDSRSTPCDQCPSCRNILSGESLDFLEIDGASNNGVDEIRQLRESIGFRPQQSRYRIILIDEVHMLSVPAFNALLKTLEEPPEHIKFIFATTEPEKVLPTVRARTQRFDFSPVNHATLVQFLEEVAQKENLQLQQGVAEDLAKLSKGNVRQALVLLDQFGTQGSISIDQIRKFSGQALPAHLEDFCRYVWLGQPAKALELLDQLIVGGVDLRVFVDQWIDLIRRAIEQKLNVLDHQLQSLEIVTLETLLDQCSTLIEVQRDLRAEGSARALLVLMTAKLASKNSQENSLELPPTKEVTRSEEKEAPVADNTAKKAQIISKPPENPSASESEQAFNIQDIQKDLEEQDKFTLKTCLNGAAMKIQGSQVSLTVAAAFHFDMIKEGDNQNILKEILKKRMGLEPILTLDCRAPMIRSEDEILSDHESDQVASTRKKVSPKIQNIAKMFEGELES